jgi:hypothetical protein
MNGLTGRLRARKGATVLRSAAHRLPPDGVYDVNVKFPEPGTWTLEIIGGSGLVGDTVTRTIDVIADGAAAPAMADTQRGRLVFESKGCVTCHQHDAFAGRRTVNLVSFSGRRFTPDFVKTFLRSVKAPPPNIESYGKMPDLGLAAHEIDALAAFLGR